MEVRPIKQLVVLVTAVLLLLTAELPHAAADGNQLTIDSKPVTLSAARVPYAFSSPARNVYRFELHSNDFGWPGDSTRDNRRAELVSTGDKYSAGTTLWTSFSFVVGAAHSSFDSGSKHNTIHQWHSVDTTVARSPVVEVQLLDGNLQVITRSDATADDGLTKIRRYSAPRPADGMVHNIVIAGLLGKSGHLKTWLDGKEIVDTDAPIGYYNDDRALAYPHWGLYQTNVGTPAVIYHANIEWGTDALFERVADPLPVIVPRGGWT